MPGRFITTSDRGSPVEAVTSDPDASTSDPHASTSDRGSLHLRSHLRNSPSGGGSPSSPVADEKTSSSNEQQHSDWSGPHWTHDVFVDMCLQRPCAPRSLWSSLTKATRERRKRQPLATVEQITQWFDGGPHELPRDGSGLRPLPRVDASTAQVAASEAEGRDDGGYSQAELRRQVELLRDRRRAAAEQQIRELLAGGPPVESAA